MSYNKLIKTEKDYNEALKRIELLFDAEEGSPEAEELELLSALVELYEKEHFPIEAPDPVSAIKFRMEQEGLTNEDMVAYLGSKSRVSEVFARKRNLSISMIRKLVAGLHIPAEVLLGAAVFSMGIFIMSL
ncbi:MAG: DNA-binding protein [Treponema sp.]|nr:DNA-binding protein [Treponema sp.]